MQLLRLPVEAEEDDPLGRTVGDPLCPELGKDAQWLQDFKASYISDPQGGQRAWTALYQCSPRQEEGNLVQRNWWKFYDPDEELPFANGDYIYVPAIRRAIEEKQSEIPAYVVKEEGLVPFTLGMGPLTDDERQIILDGCLINFYRE